jgi:hypothetical protein
VESSLLNRGRDQTTFLREKGLLKILFFSVVKRLSPSSAFHTRKAGEVCWGVAEATFSSTAEEAADTQDASESDSESESTESLDILFALVAGITYDLRYILLYIIRNLALTLQQTFCKAERSPKTK